MLDRVGITATSLCAIHCILLPVILPALPMLGLSFLADHFFEHAALLVTGIIGIIALISGFKRYHGKLYPFYFLILGVFIYWLKHDFEPSVQPYFVIVGALLIVAGHLFNLRLCKQYMVCSEHNCT